MPRASAAKKAEPVADQAPTIDDTLLAEIDEASRKPETEQNFAFVTQSEVGAMLNAGYIVVNPGITDGSGKVAARVTAAGRQYLEQNAPNLISQPVQEVQKEEDTVATAETQIAAPAAAVAPTLAAAPRAKPSISGIATVELQAAAVKRGGARPETYPFSKLEVGQSFFVAATDSMPDPAKALASTVASATNRYAEEVEGQTRTNRKGANVPVTRPTRVFKAYRVEDGAPFGAEFAGKAGAAIKRER